MEIYKSIEKYTIYCTKEQTLKALELGAPIERNWDFYSENPMDNECYLGDHEFAKIPTAEQMIGWLEANGFYFRLESFGGSVEIDDVCIYEEHRAFRKEATLAAIDAALEYLSKNKK